MLDPTLFDYIQSPRDRARLFTNPVLLMPFEDPLPPQQLGRRRYVLASDGLYVQAANHALRATVRLSDALELPFGPLQSEVELAGGPIPHELFAQMRHAALEHHPNEWAGVIHWQDGCYELTIPAVRSRSNGHITYDLSEVDRTRQVLDIHSHGHHGPFFSAADDSTDLFGLYFASVFGYCESAQNIRVLTRLVLDHHRIDLPWHPWDAELFETAPPSNSDQTGSDTESAGCASRFVESSIPIINTNGGA